MTLKRFCQMLCDLNPGNPYAAVKNWEVAMVNLPIVASFTAADCFIRELPENNATRELRRQLKHLEKKGHWDFEDETV